jgi:DNA-binding transcriptional ArsR family regulator
VDALALLADPVRRQVVELLSLGERDAGSIAAQFPGSRPAISRHLRLLREGGVVQVRAMGTRRVYSLRRDALEEMEAWLAQRLDALDTELRRGQRARRDQ